MVRRALVHMHTSHCSTARVQAGRAHGWKRQHQHVLTPDVRVNPCCREPASNLADDLLRDYEQRWWAAVRKGDEATILARLEGGGPTLARTVEEGRRSALHYAAALGRVEVVKRLLAEGAEVDLADKDGERCPGMQTTCPSWARAVYASQTLVLRPLSHACCAHALSNSTRLPVP